MSAKLNLNVRNVKTTRKSTSRAHVSSNCTCKDDHKSCGRRKDPAVDALQVAGEELSDIFKQLKNEDVAEMLVRAIRCRDARAVQRLLGNDCRVVDFFCTHDKDCVRIFCAFGRFNDVTITFDICVRKVRDVCVRNIFWF